MTFIALPQEILIEVLSNLDYRSILCCASICRELYEICKSSLQLQYIVELAMDGLEGSGFVASHSELLSHLHDRRLSWAEANWKQITRLEIENNCIAYELVAGTFAMSDGQNLSLTWLPSAMKDSHHLEYRPLGFSVRDFALDPTQDLIVVLEDDQTQISLAQGRHVRLHIRTISTNAAHALASRGTLEFDIALDLDSDNAITNAQLEIAADVIALFFKRGAGLYKPRLLLWNWRKGILIYDSESIGGSFPLNIHHVTLLSRDSFMLTSTHNSGALLLYSFVPTSPALSMPALCATLHLPPIHSYCRVRQLTADSGPISARPAAFSTDPEWHLLVLSVLYFIHRHRNPETASYNLFVHKRTFLNYINQYRRAEQTKGVAPAQSADVDWDSWGEMKTRLIPIRLPRTWSRYVHGQRVVSDFPGSQIIEVLDFNVAPYTAAELSTSRRRLHPQDEPSSRYPISLFQNDFVTRLPFYSTTRDVGENFYACMIDDERIIGLKMKGGDIMELYVYAF